jgi:hypothetical protein
MTGSILMNNPHYAASAQAIRELHRLILQGQGDSAEADEIRDKSDEHWRYLSLEEIDSLQNLSADLYFLGDPQRPDTISGSPIKNDLLQALAASDFDKAMTILRRPDVKAETKLGVVLRGQYWLSVEDYESSLTFWEEAVRLQPQNPDCLLTRLLCLWLMRDERVFDEANRLIEDSRITEPDDVVEVSTILAFSAYDRAKSRDDQGAGFGHEERLAIDRVIRALQPILTGAEDFPGQPESEFESLAHEILGFCHYLLAGFPTSRGSTEILGGVDPGGPRNPVLLDQIAERAKFHSEQVFKEKSLILAA